MRKNRYKGFREGDFNLKDSKRTLRSSLKNGENEQLHTGPPTGSKLGSNSALLCNSDSYSDSYKYILNFTKKKQEINLYVQYY